jgi:hypothetical protein
LPKLAAQKKAQIDKARSRVDALRKELDEKRQQWQTHGLPVEAEARLAASNSAR